MSVLIKGMEMPRSCDECELCTCYVREDGTEENYRCVITFYPILELDERHEYCPLVEIPPHRRLIDADALLKSISRAIEDDSDIADVYEEDYELVNDWLASAPTIIEAEGER